MSLLGSERGVVCDGLGFFRIDVPKGKVTLQISAVGFLEKRFDFEISDSRILGILNLEKRVIEMDQVVVTGTLKAISRSESPVPIQVLSAEAFQSDPSPSLLGAVAQVNGVRPQINCALCGTSDIHINGMEGPYTMILIDGMPIVSGLGSVYGLSAIPTAMIERIELIKGPGSSLYGSEAMGGVINIITKNVLFAPKYAAELSLTDWGEAQLELGASFKGKKAGHLLGVSSFLYDNPIDRNEDGYTDLTLQKRVSVFYKSKFERPHRRKAGIGLRLINEDRWGGEMDWTPADKGLTSTYGESISTKRYELIGEYQLPATENILAQVSLNGHFQDSYYGTTYYKADQSIGFAQLTWQHKYSHLLDLIAGSSIKHRKYNDNTTVTEDLNGDSPVNTLIPGVFLQNEMSLSLPSTLLLGYRLDQHPDHGPVHSPRIAYRFRPSGKISVRASFATGFRVVDVFSEDHAALTGSRTVQISDELAPERSINGTLNLVRRFTGEKNFLELDLTAFHSEFSNRIVADLDTDPELIIYDNLNGKAHTQGVSFDQYARLGERWKIRNGVSFMQVNTAENGLKEDVLFAPKWSGTANVVFKHAAHSSIDLSAKWYGSMRLPVQPNDPRPEYSTPYALLNFQYRKNLGKGIALFGGIRNVLDFVPENVLLRPHDPFDEQVDDPIDNPNGLSFDTTYIYASMQGRRFFAGLRYSLDR